MDSKFIGRWAFIIGLAFAVIASFLTEYETTVPLVLFVLGLVVGFLNISEKNSNKFLLATIVLLIGGIASMSAVAMSGIVGVLINYLTAILRSFVAFVGAAALVVAIKVIFETSKK